MVICLATALELPDDPADDPPQALASRPVATAAAARYLRRTISSLTPMTPTAEGGQPKLGRTEFAQK
jgi:hypothetical protein